MHITPRDPIFHFHPVSFQFSHSVDPISLGSFPLNIDDYGDDDNEDYGTGNGDRVNDDHVDYSNDDFSNSSSKLQLINGVAARDCLGNK